ncbi:sugar transferase [Pseudomonas sp. GZD-222]|uniref:sugar transferase n=1 Tax=Pseudomonas sp. GZD-222 TaxID=3404805 RepID=UPI003BB49FD0
MLKRIFDLSLIFLLALPALLVTAVVAVLVALFIGRPVLFKQKRPGLNGKPFNMYKFRSMTESRDESGALLADELRLTPFGRFLRSTSLDELPGLWSVINGDMSLVGPRPLLMEYLPLYSPDQLRRHNVRPGITGWAQVNGRNALSWPEKFEYDVWYVDNQSFWLDIKILFLTAKKVLVREGVSAQGEATMSKFEGNKNE